MGMNDMHRYIPEEAYSGERFYVHHRFPEKYGYDALFADFELFGKLGLGWRCARSARSA